MKSIALFLSSALLLWLASPGPGFSFCAWFALFPLLAGCAQIPPKKAAFLGFVSGLIYYVLLVYWVVISLGTYGNLPWWLCALALLLLSAYMSLYLAFFCAALSWSMKLMPPIWVGPFLWVALDFIRGWLFTGFPWQDLGYSQFNTPLLIQTADLAGHHGITFLIVLANCLLFTLSASAGKAPWSRKTPFIQISTAVLLLALAFVYSFSRINQIEKMEYGADRHQVSVIQSNIDQNQKWHPDKQREAIEKHIALSAKARQKQLTDLVIWPETAMPFHPPSSPLFPELLSRTVFEDGYSLLAGAPYFLDDGQKMQLYNSAILARPNGEMYRYFKQHLVPFGEYIPFADILPLPGPVVESVGNFSSGKEARPLKSGQASLGVLICFESIFPKLARKEVENGANLLVNITNDAWFGRSSASIQHLAMVVFRAVENRRSVARSANSGISCFIDSTGRISQPTPLFTPCFINSSVALFDTITFFNSFGHFFPLFCLIYLIPLALLLKTRISVKDKVATSHHTAP